jgi:hypothetical protein
MAGKMIPGQGISAKRTQFWDRSGVFKYIQYLLKSNAIPMTPYIRNNQDHLAEEFRRFDNYLLQESRIALLKIQSWQFAMKTPEVGEHYQQEATDMVKKSLLSFVPNSFVLSEEGYYYKPLSN